MKKLVMLTLVVAGVLSISACEEENFQPSDGETVVLDDGGDGDFKKIDKPPVEE